MENEIQKTAAVALWFVYTRNADDLRFSTQRFDVSGGQVRQVPGRVRFLVEQAGFFVDLFVDHRKTRVMRRGRRQEVIGIGANDAVLRIERKKLPRFRAAVNQLKRNGILSGHPRRIPE